MSKKEFRLENEYEYNRSGPVRWIISHLLRYPMLPILAVLAAIVNNVGYSYIQIFIGRAFDVIVSENWVTAALVVPAVGAFAG
ncbi:MAG: hypothetical protein GWO38_03725, partial [Phycisphaerae bacterium]|nr:hypothetical protein [Phycisphaerae bacterium]NIP50910.1 hypothetical protein [Phycisphaerae bacterium]NIW91845.1 hypothetical protein [Phycisphaerae bacterium]NIX26751.1 hypothetical protein [Phycisphaerae bacterium]